MFTELVKALALLLTLCFLHASHIRLWRQKPTAGRLTSGLLFGSIAAISMLSPLVSVGPGAIFDVRSVVLSMAGLFGGPVVAGLAVVMAGTARLWIGGAGTWVGLSVIVLSAALGMAFRWALQRGLVQVRPVPLLGFGLLLHAVALGMAQWLPDTLAQEMNQRLTLLLLLLSAPATALVGLLLRDVEDRMTTEQALQESAARLHAIAYAIPDVLLVLDAQGRYVEVLSPEESALAAPAPVLLGKRLHEVLPTAQADRFMELIRTTLRSGQTESVEYVMETLSGPRHFEGRGRALGHTGQRPGHGALPRPRHHRAHAGRERAARIRTALSLAVARHSRHLGAGLPRRWHHELLEQGLRNPLRLHRTGSTGPQPAGPDHPDRDARAGTQGCRPHVRHRPAHPGRRAAPAAQGWLARRCVLQPHAHCGTGAAPRDVLHRHRHLRPQGRRGRSPLPRLLRCPHRPAQPTAADRPAAAGHGRQRAHGPERGRAVRGHRQLQDP
jgi:PAS domain-containing protein